ncbi:hypothetical protein [Fibrisoma montanum]|uniref:hypothetical protein n=1 Tax=Fibrisoma montanum TaxID=2305895 RepID=UPI001314D7CA|nr:hypothetical protein [Fibrisoma montanum]
MKAIAKSAFFFMAMIALATSCSSKKTETESAAGTESTMSTDSSTMMSTDSTMATDSASMMSSDSAR